ncbi:alpha amylase family protein [Bacteroides heparinolyticus]|uniref:alpha amylase family protein n=3 Tax=Prevotella heparinolytica TaxID=28113 RepID=UPI00359F82E8
MEKKTIVLSVSVLLCLFMACGSLKGAPQVTEKNKLIWLDLSANWERFSHADSIKYYVQKCQDAGFNYLVLDVKGTASAVAYPSNIAPRLTEWKGVERMPDYDFVKLFIDEAHRRGMKVLASFNIFCEGSGLFKRGIIYDTHKNWQSINYVPGKGLIPVTEIEDKMTLFTNPALPAVQEYERSILVECAKMYPIDGIMVDRTRYDNLQSDFSDFSRNAFETYIRQKVERFPEDIYEWVKQEDGSYKCVTGSLFKQWIEWRASVIYRFFKDTRAALKAARPDIIFAAYTGAWYPSYYEVGANWASRTYDPSGDFSWATERYKDYAYAELLDLYTNGNYYWNVTLEEYRKSNGTHKNETDSKLSSGEHLCVEGGCLYSRQLLGNNPFCGGLYVEDYKHDVEQFKRAVKMNLKMSDGLMVFDIVHIISRNWWDVLTQAVKEAEQEMHAESMNH